ncbi:serine/threonine-protein kinase/endoribonuclease IRE1-like [Arapaima gigas]
MTLFQQQADFVRNYRREITKKAEKIQPIADSLCSQGILSSAERIKIQAAGSTQEGMMELLRSLERGGTSAKSKLYLLLQLHEPALLREIEHARFAEDHMAEIIQKVGQVEPIADALLSQGLVNGEEHCRICTGGTTKQKMRELYRSLETGGTSGKTALYWLLLRHEPDLIMVLDATVPLRRRNGTDVPPGTNELVSTFKQLLLHGEE